MYSTMMQSGMTYQAVSADGVHFPASFAQNGTKSLPPFPSRRSPGANLFDRVQGLYHAGFSAREPPKPRVIDMDEHAPLDLSHTKSKVKSPRNDVMRDVDSPLDLSVKTRKRSADTTDVNNDEDDVIFLKQEGPSRTKYTKGVETHINYHAFNLPPSPSRSPRGTYCNNKGNLMSPSPIKELPRYVGVHGSQGDVSTLGAQSGTISNQQSVSARHKLMQHIIPSDARQYQLHSRRPGDVGNPQSQLCPNMVIGTDLHIPNGTNSKVSPERQFLNRTLPTTRGNVISTGAYSSKSEVVSQRRVSPAALDAFVALRQKNCSSYVPSQEIHKATTSSHISESSQEDVFQHRQESTGRQGDVYHLPPGQIPPMPPLIKISPSASSPKGRFVNSVHSPVQSEVPSSLSQSGLPDYRPIPNHHTGRAHSHAEIPVMHHHQQHRQERMQHGLHIGSPYFDQSTPRARLHHARAPLHNPTSHVRFQHNSAPAHSQSTSHVRLQNAGAHATAQAASQQVRHARMSAPLQHIRKLRHGICTPPEAQGNVNSSKAQQMSLAKDQPRNIYGSSTPAEKLIGEPRVHIQTHTLPKYSHSHVVDNSTKNINQSTENFHKVTDTAVNRNTELVGQPRLSFPPTDHRVNVETIKRTDKNSELMEQSRLSQFPTDHRTSLEGTTDRNRELVGQPRLSQRMAADPRSGHLPSATVRHLPTGQVSGPPLTTSNSPSSVAASAAALQDGVPRMSAGALQELAFHSNVVSRHAALPLTSKHIVRYTSPVSDMANRSTSGAHSQMHRTYMVSANDQTAQSGSRLSGGPCAQGEGSGTLTMDNAPNSSLSPSVAQQQALKKDFIRAMERLENLGMMNRRRETPPAQCGSIINGTPLTPFNKIKTANAVHMQMAQSYRQAAASASKTLRNAGHSQTLDDGLKQGSLTSNQNMAIVKQSNDITESRHGLNTSTPCHQPVGAQPNDHTNGGECDLIPSLGPSDGSTCTPSFEFTDMTSNRHSENYLNTSVTSAALVTSSAPAETSLEQHVSSSTVSSSVPSNTRPVSTSDLSSVPNLSAFIPTDQGNNYPSSPVRDRLQDTPPPAASSARPATMLQAVELSARSVTYRDYKKNIASTDKTSVSRGLNKPCIANKHNTRYRAAAVASSDGNSTDEADELTKYRSSLRMPPQLCRGKSTDMQRTTAAKPSFDKSTTHRNTPRPDVSSPAHPHNPAKPETTRSNRARSKIRKKDENATESNGNERDVSNVGSVVFERSDDNAEDFERKEQSNKTSLKHCKEKQHGETHAPVPSLSPMENNSSIKRTGSRKGGNGKIAKEQSKSEMKGERTKCKVEPTQQTAVDTREFSEKFAKTFGRKHSQGLFETLAKSFHISTTMDNENTRVSSKQSTGNKNLTKESTGNRLGKTLPSLANKEYILSNEEMKNIWCRMKTEKQQGKSRSETPTSCKIDSSKTHDNSPGDAETTDVATAKRNSPKRINFTTKKFSMNLKKLSPLMRKASQALMQEMQRRGHLTRMSGSSGPASGKKSPRLSPKRASTPIKSIYGEGSPSVSSSPIERESEEGYANIKATKRRRCSDDIKECQKTDKDAVKPYLRNRGRQLLREKDYDSDSCSRDTSRESRETSLDSLGRSSPTSRTRRKRMLEEIANTDGYVAERRGQKIEDLFAHPSQLDREARWLQRAMMQFSKMEMKKDGDDVTGPRRKKNPHSSALTTAAQLRRRACRITNKAGISPQKVSEVNPEILPKRTRATGLERIRRRSYNKNAAYEAELSREEERLELKRANRQARREKELSRVKVRERPGKAANMSLDEGEESHGDADDISPRRGGRRIPVERHIPGTRKSKRTVKIEVEQDVTGYEDADTDEYYYEDAYAHEAVSENLPSHLHDELSFTMEDGMLHVDETDERQQDMETEAGIQGRRTPPMLKKLSCSKTSGETVLHRAARMGYTDVVLHCLETKRGEINARDNAGYTPLHESCVRGNLTIAKYLLEYGANVNCSSQDGIRPIHDAVENDHLEIVRLLLSYGADPTLVTYSGRTLQKIARSNAMKVFLEGYFSDLRPDEKGSVRHPWEFPGTSAVLDSEVELGYDIFASLLSDSDGGYESDIEFELGDKPHVPCYNIVCEDDHGPCNYVVLFDVLDYLDMKKNDFINFHGNLTFVSLKMSEFAEAIESSVVNNRCKWLSGNMANLQEYIELVKLDENLRRIMGTTMESMQNLTQSRDILLTDIEPVDASSFPLESHNVVEIDAIASSIKKELNDYDEGDLQLEAGFNQSEAVDALSQDDDEPPVLYVMCDPAELKRPRFQSPVHPSNTDATDVLLTTYDGLHERGTLFAVKEGTTAEKLSAELPFPPEIRPLIPNKPSGADDVCELRIADVCSLAGKGEELYNNSASTLPSMFESQVSENMTQRQEQGMDDDTDDDMPQLTMCT